MKWNGPGSLWLGKKHIKAGQEIPASLEGLVVTKEARKKCSEVSKPAKSKKERR